MRCVGWAQRVHHRTPLCRQRVISGNHAPVAWCSTAILSHGTPVESSLSTPICHKTQPERGQYETMKPDESEKQRLRCDNCNSEISFGRDVLSVERCVNGPRGVIPLGEILRFCSERCVQDFFSHDPGRIYPAFTRAYREGTRSTESLKYFALLRKWKSLSRRAEILCRIVRSRWGHQPIGRESPCPPALSDHGTSPIVVGATQLPVLGKGGECL